MLSIDSINDPITPFQEILDDIKLNLNIFLIVTDKGAHMTFIFNEKVNELKQLNLKTVFKFLNSQSVLEL